MPGDPPPMDLTDGLRTVGRPAEPLVAEVRRPLTAADLAVLDQPRPSADPPDLKRITDRHHLLARSLAAGMSETEAAVRTGITVNRVSILKADPAFKDLVSHYRSLADAKFGDLQEKLASLGHEAVDLLADRLEADPATFSHDQLVDIGKFAADRTGHGPTTKQQVNIRVDLAERLRLARERADNAKSLGGPVLDLQPIGTSGD